MNEHEFRAACARLGLLRDDGFGEQIGQQVVADFLGRSKRTINSWLNAEVPVPAAVAMLMNVLVRLNLPPAELTRMLRTPPEIARYRAQNRG